jgi:membrane protease YdiL (CAAX protease family)
VLLLGALVFLSISMGVLSAQVAVQIFGDNLTPNGAMIVRLVLGVLGSHAMALVWVHFFLRQHQLTWREAFGVAPERIVSAATVALAVLPAIIGGVLLLSLGSQWLLTRLHELAQWSWMKVEPQSTVQLLQDTSDPWMIVAQGIVAIVLAPVAEEVLFRGILYTWIKQSGRQRLALWVTSVLFAAIHFYPVGFLSLILLALVLVAIYERSQTLLAPIFLHALFNGLNFALIVAQPEWVRRMFEP